MANGFQITPVIPAVTTATPVAATPATTNTAASAAVTAALNSTATASTTPVNSFGSLLPGQTVTAQVSQVLNDGVVRLTLPSGTLDIKPSVPIPVGVAVVIQVPQSGAQVKLSLPPSILPVGASATATVVGGHIGGQRLSTGANALNAQSLSFLAEMGATQASKINALNANTATGLPKVPVTNVVSDVVRQVIGQAVTTAVNRQDSLAPLFSSLTQVMARFTAPVNLEKPAIPVPVNPLVESLFPHRAQQNQSGQPLATMVLPDDGGEALPRNVLQAVERVLATQMQFGEVGKQNNIREGLIQSGLFSFPMLTPKGLVSTPLSPTPTVDAALKLLGFPVQQDAPSPAAVEKALKVLVSLEAARASAPSSGQLPVTAGAESKVPSLLQAQLGVLGQAGAGGSSAPVVEAIARLFGVTLPAGTPVTLDMLRQAVQKAATGAQSGGKGEADAAKPAVSGGGQALTAPPLGSDLKSALRALRQELLQWIGRGGEALSAVTPVSRRPSPPRPVGNPAPQSAGDAALMKDMSAHKVGERLLAQTEAALARQGLLQWASLPEGSERVMGRAEGAPPPVVFEVPALMNGQNAVIQFHIERDASDGSGSDDEESGKAWQAKFAVAVEPMGPVHAHITLRGDVTNVTLWAEREDTAETLKAQLLDLRDSLAGANFEVHDLVCRLGSPDKKAGEEKAATGYFLDQKT